jgi:beta-mannosidase
MRTAKFIFIAAIIAICPAFLSAAKTASAPATTQAGAETLLSGPGWKLGSFPLGEGETQGAFKPDFNDSSFPTVLVPGEVQLQTGLKGNDLFVQSKSLSLINNQEWWYRRSFKVPAEAAGKLVRLQLEGAAYFSAVWLNGEKLGEHEGEVEAFSFDISKLVKYGAENTLAVRVTAPWLPKGRGLPEYAKSSFSLYYLGEGITLKNPPYFMGGGWGEIPVYGNAALIVGLNRDVKLLVSEPVVLQDLFVSTKSLNADGSATLEISGNAKNYRDAKGPAQIGFDLVPANFQGETVHVTAKTLSLQPGDNRFTQEAVVRNPQLWWTWDLGKQNLYRLEAKLGEGAGGAGNSGSTLFGIRTISRDANFSYQLNGQRIFLRGAWYPMGDYYPSRATRQSYERDLKTFRATNSNHLVAQEIERPEFFSLCDELGLLVFIQMPYNQFGPLQVIEAGNPRREPYVQNAREQARDMVTALRNHPSIVQWSPVAEAHDNGKWAGSQEGYEYFIGEVEKVIQALSPDTIFHPSLCDLGEKHKWNGNYREYFNFAPLLVSEYGEESPSNLDSFSKLFAPGQLWSARNKPRIFNLPIDLQAWMYWSAWEYSDANFGMLNLLKREHLYVDRNVGSAQELVDDTQLHHAFMLAYPTEAFRRKMHNPINGIRTWAFTNTSPGIHATIVDSDGTPKMNYYFYKRAQQPLALSFAYQAALESQVSGKRLQIPVWIANDYRRNVPLAVTTEILTTSGEVVWSRTFDAEALPDASRQIGLVDWTTPEKPGVYSARPRNRKRRQPCHRQHHLHQGRAQGIRRIATRAGHWLEAFQPAHRIHARGHGSHGGCGGRGFS